MTATPDSTVGTAPKRQDEASGLPELRSGKFDTNDGYTLHYWEAGEGKPLVMIPGWSQTAAQWRGQLALADQYRIIALDMRGHGESSKGAHGYRIHRLSKDLHDFLEYLGPEHVTLIGSPHGRVCDAGVLIGSGFSHCRISPTLPA